MNENREEFQDAMKTIRAIVNVTTDSNDAQYYARNLEQQVKILTLKYRKGNSLSNLLSENTLTVPQKRH